MTWRSSESIKLLSFFFMQQWTENRQGNIGRDIVQWRRKADTFSPGNHWIVKRWLQKNRHVGSGSRSKLHTLNGRSLWSNRWIAAKQRFRRSITYWSAVLDGTVRIIHQATLIWHWIPSHSHEWITQSVNSEATIFLPMPTFIWVSIDLNSSPKWQPKLNCLDMEFSIKKISFPFSKPSH